MHPQEGKPYPESRYWLYRRPCLSSHYWLDRRPCLFSHYWWDRRPCLSSWQIALFFCLSLTLCQTAGATELKINREALTKVTRIAIIAPFFCTDTLKREAKNAGQQQYRETLRMLEETLQHRLPGSLGESQRFRIAPPELVTRKLHVLGWTPQDLYEDEAALQGKWPVPIPKRAVKLANLLKVDAILFAVMREPASVKEGYQMTRSEWNLNPLNFSLRRFPNHVTSPVVRAFLYNQQGNLVWTDEQIAEYPRTKPNTMRSLRVDWQEATLKVAQQLTDDLMRFVLE